MNKKEKKRKEGTGEREEGRKGRKEERGREGEIGCDMTSLLVQENSGDQNIHHHHLSTVFGIVALLFSSQILEI